MRRCGPNSPNVLPSLQITSTILESCSKTAARLARRGLGTQLLQAYGALRLARDEMVQAMLFGCLAAVGVHDSTLGPAFEAHGWLPGLVDYVDRKLRNPKLVISAVRALTGLLGPITARGYAAAGALAKATRVMQVYSTQLRHHKLLKCSLRLVGKLLQHEDIRPPLSVCRSGVRRLLMILVEWIKMDVRRKHDDIRREIVLSLQKLVARDTGKRAFIDVGGIGAILGIIEELESTHAVRCDNFIGQCFTLLRKSRPLPQLPVLPAPLSFKLPLDLLELERLMPDDDFVESDDEDYLDPTGESRSGEDEEGEDDDDDCVDDDAGEDLDGSEEADSDDVAEAESDQHHLPEIRGVEVVLNSSTCKSSEGGMWCIGDVTPGADTGTNDVDGGLGVLGSSSTDEGLESASGEVVIDSEGGDSVDDDGGGGRGRRVW